MAEEGPPLPQKEEGVAADGQEDEDISFQPTCLIRFSPDRRSSLIISRQSALQFFRLDASGTAVSQLIQPEEALGHHDLISGVCYSEDGKLVATCGDDKLIKVWDAESFRILFNRTHTKKITSVLISQKPRHLLWADKFGEVRHVSLDPLPQYGDAELRKPSGLEGSFLLGHISLITDLALSPASDLILSADRDEKVRVSRFPFAAEIEAYCLGHTEYVSRILVLSNQLLLSGSADGTLRIWNYRTGEPQFTYKREPATTETLSPLSRHETHVAVISQEPSIAHLEVYLLDAAKPSLRLLHRVLSEAGLSDAAFDAQGNLWLIRDSGVVSCFTPQGECYEPLAHPLLPALNSPELLRSATGARSSRLVKKRPVEGYQEGFRQGQLDPEERRRRLPSYVKQALKEPQQSAP
jgi:hypothetical protein